MGRDWYGPESFKIGTPEHTASTKNRGHINYKPPYTPPPPSRPQTIYNPQIFPNPAPKYGQGDGGGTSSEKKGNGAKILLLLLGGFLFLGYLGSQSNDSGNSGSRNSTSTSSSDSSAPQETTPSPAPAPKPRPVNPQPTSSLQAYLNDSRLQSYVEEINSINGGISGNRPRVFLSNEGMLISTGDSATEHREFSVDVGSLDLSSAHYDLSNQTVVASCNDGSACVHARTWNGNILTNSTTYTGQGIWVQDPRNADRLIWDLRMMQRYVSAR